MSALKSHLQSLAVVFAEDVVRAIRGASLQELLGEVGGKAARPNGPAPKGRIAHGPSPMTEPAGLARAASPLKRGRLKRRSEQDIAATLDRIVSLLKQHADGLRAEQIRKELNMLAKEMPRPLAQGLESKALRKKGQKRATVYFAAGGAAPSARAPSAATPRPSKRTARKK
jgi:hypothetical protein